MFIVMLHGPSNYYCIKIKDGGGGGGGGWRVVTALSIFK